MPDIPLLWYEQRDVGDGITQFSQPHIHRYFAANFFHLRGRDADLIIDFGMGLQPLRPLLDVLPGKPLIALATHIHADHIGAFHEFETRLGHPREAEAFAQMTDEDTLARIFRELPNAVTQLPYPGWTPGHYQIIPAPLTRQVDEGDVIDLGDRQLHVLHLPGHSHGSIALLEQERGILFSGDVIYRGGLVDDLPCSDKVVYRRSMERLLNLEIRVGHGGHGPSMDQAQMHEIARGYLQGSVAMATAG